MTEKIQCVESFWKDLGKMLSLDDSKIDDIWAIILNKYGEIHRSYHTLDHIYQLLHLSTKYSNLLVDLNSVNLAIIFHDIIYNPNSKQNEDDSASLFMDLFQYHIEQERLEKVCLYIIATKNHLTSIHNEDDVDLLYFLDFDLSILGSSPYDYSVYSLQIRQEYIHIDQDLYCKERSRFLRNLSTKELFLTELFRQLLGSVAVENILWECAVLDEGLIPSIRRD